MMYICLEAAAAGCQLHMSSVAAEDASSVYADMRLAVHDRAAMH
jgi:hypothetical protein